MIFEVIEEEMVFYQDDVLKGGVYLKAFSPGEWRKVFFLKCSRTYSHRSALQTVFLIWEEQSVQTRYRQASVIEEDSLILVGSLCVWAGGSSIDFAVLS